MQSFLVFSLLFCYVLGDTYMHHPRGSNNRLNERSANRDNDARGFNSQNNNRGGYNVGDKSNNPFNGGNPFAAPATTFNVDDNSQIQYQMMYFEESILTVEWTAQHGCGGNEKSDTARQNCNMVLQYMCDFDDTSLPGDIREVMKVGLRDGGNTGTPDAPGSYGDIGSTTAGNAANQRFRQESEANYFYCRNRNQNEGLFHADQKLQGDSAIYTRQNPNGNRNGLECPEERDYFPYWAISGWRDVAYLTDHPEEHCPIVQAGTQNTNMVHYCAGWDSSNFKRGPGGNLAIPINKTECEGYGGTWGNYTKKFVPAPECKQAEWTRENHLGNGRDSQPLTYNWTLPNFDQLKQSGALEYPSTGSGYIRCVLRLRYNISTDDYDPWNISSAQDNNPGAGIISPVTQNPTINIGGMTLQGLKLAVNTAQFGRTFQDRSHIFYVVKRPTNGLLTGKKVYNLGVRGKRGNIVQTYPAVEYDFVSNRLPVMGGEFIHLQWTGSNTHNNGEPAGDGQAGDAGEGTTGTDRSNFCWHHNASDNFPMPLDKPNPFSMYYFECFRPVGGTALTWMDCAMILATSGQYQSISDSIGNFDPLLNDAPASLVQGILLRVNGTAAGATYNYMCTRNNNFSNRSQKGQIVVV